MSGTGPTGSATIYPTTSGGVSKLCITDRNIPTSSWNAKGGTAYPDKNHQKITDHKNVLKAQVGGSGSDSPYSYPQKYWQKKFASVKRQT